MAQVNEWRCDTKCDTHPNNGSNNLPTQECHAPSAFRRRNGNQFRPGTLLIQMLEDTQISQQFTSLVYKAMQVNKIPTF